MNARIAALTMLLAASCVAGFAQSASPSSTSKLNAQQKTREGQETGPTKPPTPSRPQIENVPANKQNGPPIWSNWALVLVAALTALAAIKTLRAIEDQVVEMRNTGKQTDKLIRENIAQSTSLERSVAESARFAAAMEGVAKSLEITAEASQQAAIASQQSITNLRQQMRAWLTVIIGNGIPQPRDKNLRFEASPLILNSGLTPARNVRHRIKSGIFPIPLPDDFDQSVTAENEAGGNLIGAHRNAQMISVVDDYVPDGEVEDIKAAKGRGVYAWGIVTYEDVFGETHTTTFCQQLTYLPDGKLWVSYIPGRNDAD